MDEKEWRAKFAARIQKMSNFPEAFCRDCAEGAEYHPEMDPEEAADTEMSYWEDDGDNDDNA
jgi:hypothetical protein